MAASSETQSYSNVLEHGAGPQQPYPVPPPPGMVVNGSQPYPPGMVVNGPQPLGGPETSPFFDYVRHEYWRLGQMYLHLMEWQHSLEQRENALAMQVQQQQQQVQRKPYYAAPGRGGGRGGSNYFRGRATRGRGRGGYWRGGGGGAFHRRDNRNYDPDDNNEGDPPDAADANEFPALVKSESKDPDCNNES